MGPRCAPHRGTIDAVLIPPVPIVDVHVEAGVARLESTVKGSICYTLQWNYAKAVIPPS
jgi:hypothetical protein